MNKRINIGELQPEAYKAVLVLENFIAQSTLDPLHWELIKIRASQLNGCAYCIDKHTKDARKKGETEQRIYALNAWRETPFFTKEEQAILSITEEVTFISQHVKDETYEKAVEVLGKDYLALVIMASALINLWNRIGISTGMQPSL